MATPWSDPNHDVVGDVREWAERARDMPAGPPPAAPPPPGPAHLAAWASLFKEAAAEASRCPVCRRLASSPCRCYVPAEQRPDPVPAGLAAVYPLIAAFAAGGE